MKVSSVFTQQPDPDRWTPRWELEREAREARVNRRAFIDPDLGWPVPAFVGPFSCVTCRGEVIPYSMCPVGGRSFCSCGRAQSQAEAEAIYDRAEARRHELRHSFGGIVP